MYESADVIPSTTKVGINTDTAQTWGGSFFETSRPTGANELSFGGKHASHSLITDTVTYGGTSQSSVQKIAIASMNGRALCLATVNDNSIVTTVGSTVADLSETFYNANRGKTGFKVCSMLGFNNAVYVHYSYNDGTPTVHYNAIVKYTCTSGGSVEETVAQANVSNTAYADASWMTIANNNLYVLIKDNKLVRFATSSNNYANISTTVSSSQYAGITSITSTNLLTSSGGVSSSDVNHEYLIIARDPGSNFVLYVRYQ